jgi:hypothetical protein
MDADQVTADLLDDFSNYHSVDYLGRMEDIPEWARRVAPDVAYNVHTVKFLARFCDEWGLDFPAIQLRGYYYPIPVDFTFGKSHMNQRQMREFFDQTAKDRVLDIGRCFFGRASQRLLRGSSELLAVLEQGIRDFLRSREDRSGLSRLGFTVETSSLGLRVHYSPTYLFKQWDVFGNTLTTPVHGRILPGSYVFGVMGSGMREPRFSDAIFHVPPQNHAHLPEL